MKELVFSRTLIPAAEQRSDEVGFIDAASGRQVSFGQHLARVARLSDALVRQLGVAPGDRVAVLAANGIEYLELWHSCLLGAAVINPLNVRFSPEELTYVLRDSDCRACFVDGGFAPVVESIADAAGLARVVRMGPGGSYEDLVAAGKEQFPPEPEEESPAVLIYTGGTTGRPKGVVLDQRAEVLNQYHFAMRVPWRADQPFLIQTPMFHGASMLGVAGAPMFGVPSVILPGFSPAGCLDATERYSVGMTVMVPTMIGMLLNHPEFDPGRLSSLARIIYGASPMPPPVLERLLDALPHTEVIQGYGMTEGCTILTTLDDDQHRSGARPASAGRALPGVELCAQDPEGRPLGPGQVGEICARGGNFMVGYHNLPEETAEALRGGWFHSGDVGYLDDQGYLFLVDRAKDMIITGGENVYSVEVENALSSHPSVAQVAVIGIPDDRWGEAVHAVVVLRPGHQATPEDLQAHARERIAGYKVPRSIEFRDQPLPLSAAMKVLKRELRAPYWKDRDRAIN